MKYPPVNEPVFVVSIELINSRYGSEVYELKMMGIKTQKPYKTYIDPRNANWLNWSWIVDLAERKGIVLTKCKLKDPEQGIINADSTPTPEYVVTKDELADILEEYWKRTQTYNKLFGDENGKSS